MVAGAGAAAESFGTLSSSEWDLAAMETAEIPLVHLDYLCIHFFMHLSVTCHAPLSQSFIYYNSDPSHTLYIKGVHSILE